MKRKPPIIIVAVDQTGGFGKKGKIPWHLPEDLQHFKKITDGHICVMGRYTYEDILEAREIRDKEKNITEPITEILRGRESYVVSSRFRSETLGATKITRFSELYKKIPPTDDREIFVIGGRRMFFEALSTCEKIHMTIVKGDPYHCDVQFPIEVLNKKWKIVSGEETEKAYFVVYNKK
jgi:dihydrofolate reductase